MSTVLRLDETTLPKAHTQPGRIIAKELDHLDEDDLVRVVLYLARQLATRLRITAAMYRGKGMLDIKRALSDERAESAARSLVQRIRQRKGCIE